MAGQIIGDNTTVGFTGAAFNQTTPKQFEGGVHEVILNANQRVIEYGVLWMISPSNGTNSGNINVCLYDLDTEAQITGTNVTIPYNGSTLTAGGVDVHVKATGLSIDVSAHSGKRIGLGLAPPTQATSSGFKVGIRTVTGPRRNNHSTTQSTNPATFVVASTVTDSSWGIYAITEDIPASQTVTSINGGAAIRAGQTGISAVLTGFTALPSITTNTSGVTVSGVAGTDNAPTFNISDRVEGGLYPALPSSVQFTFTNGSETASGSQSVTFKTGEVKVTLSSPNTSDSTYVGTLFTQDGHTANGGDFYYVPYGDLSIAADGKVTVTTTGTFTGWFRPSTGTTAGRMYEYNITVQEDESIVPPGKNLASEGLTGKILSTSGIVAVGL